MTGRLSLVSVKEDVDPVEGLLAELVQRVHAGDEQAFEEIYHHTVDRIFGLVRRILGTPADAEEVTEDVYLYLWKHAGRFDRDRGTVMTWLFNLAHSRAIDRLRALRRQARTGQALASALMIASVLGAASGTCGEISSTISYCGLTRSSLKSTILWSIASKADRAFLRVAPD